MANIRVSGSMYEANYVEVSDDEIKTLVKLSQESGDILDELPDISEGLYGDSRINGFVFEKTRSHFQVDVDGVALEGIGTAVLKEYADLQPSNFFLPDEHKSYLVYEKWSRDAELTFETEDDFDRDSLEFVQDDLTLPGGLVRYVVYPLYEGDDFTFEGSWTDKESLCIVRSNGEVIELKL